MPSQILTFQSEKLEISDEELSAMDKICFKHILGNMVTIMSPEGKPIQVNASALQAASAQNSMGMLRLVT